MINDKEFLVQLAQKTGLEYIDLSEQNIDSSATSYISDTIARNHNVVPIGIKNGKLLVAIDDPLNDDALKDIAFYSKLEVVPILSSREDIKKKIEELYSTKENTEQTIREIGNVGKSDYQEIDTSSIEINNAPIVRLVNSIFSDAVSLGASDIHIEPFEKLIRVRMRIDGDLSQLSEIPINMLSSIVSRIKVISNLNIAETMKPQDGRVKTLINGTMVNMRISIIPTIFGEKIVIRLLNTTAEVIDKTQIGLSEVNMERVNKLLKISEGIILLTGPTGSGKTTTLYSILKDFNVINKNIITLEDPVEYQVFGINQVQVNSQAGMTFASGLRSILRQDPDIVMLGEIRDEETAQIAIRAAVTGHIVLSTLHTNDTASSISRLIDMNIPKYMVSSAVAGIIAQRLVKRICPFCKEEYDITEEEKLALNVNEDIKLYRGKGCSKCNNSGYKGRIAIHEVLILDNGLKSQINAGASDDKIKEAACNSGMLTLGDSARELVLSGVTTIEEMNRATFSL